MPPHIWFLGEWAGQRACLVVLVATAEIVDEHLLDGLVVSDKEMADGASANEVADFFREVLGVVAGAFE
jgi:hypothetical protein